MLHGVLLVVLWLGGLDNRISDLFFDEATGAWPWVGEFWAKTVFHDRARDLVFVVSFFSLVFAAVAQVRVKLRRFRDPALFFALSVGITVAVVGGWKELSAIPCPWTSLRYGGAIPHLAFPASYPEGLPLGKCFPGAHASGAFAFMALYFALRPFGRKLSWIGLGAGWTMGMIYGAAQVVRGAHYASHNLWSGIIAWSIVVLLYLCFFRRKLRRNTNAESGTTGS